MGVMPQALPQDFSVTKGPNHAFSPSGCLVFFIISTTISLVIAVTFAAMGAWLVLPFAGLEVAVLGWVLCHVLHHRDDYERIAVSGDKLSVETCLYKKIRYVEFNRYWARLFVRCRSTGDRCRLWVRSHGREVELGRFMNDDERLTLARRLRESLGS